MDISLMRRGINLSPPVFGGEVEVLEPPSEVRIPLRQAVGVACKPTVEVGAAVRRGQAIAKPLEAEGAPLHAPIGGKVRAIEEMVAFDGKKVRSIVIEANGAETNAVLEPCDAPLKLSRDEMLKRIGEAGIVVPGKEPLSLAFVLAEASSPRGHIAATGEALRKAVDHLVIRCIDPDPFLAHLSALTTEAAGDTGDLELGVQLLAGVTGAQNVHLAIDRRSDASAIEKLADEHDWSIVRLRRNQYPTACDALLAKQVSGREPSMAFGRVFEHGVVVVDLDNVLEVARALRDGMPVVEKTVSVCGPQGVRVFRAPLGTSFKALLSRAGWEADWGKVVVGGAMTGMAYHDVDFPVAKDLFGSVLFERGSVPMSANGPCISCGLCVMVCPMRLVPGILSKACEFGQLEMAQQADLFSCIECGSCGQVCPAGRSMVQFMVHGKSELLASWRTS